MTRKTKMWRVIVPYGLDEGDEDALVRLAWELHNLYPKLEEYQRTKSITVATDCMEWLAKTLEIDE